MTELSGATDRGAVLEQLSLLRFFPPEAKEEIAPFFREESYSFGESIIREGEPGDAFYVITGGRARVVKKGDNDREVPLDVLRPGDEFGEMAILQGAVRTATVRCSSDTTVLRLDGKDFQKFLSEYPELRQYIDLRIRHRTMHNFLREFSEFGKLPLPVLRAFLEHLTPIHFAENDVIIREGEVAGPMYIIQEGRVRIFTQRDGKVRDLAFYRAGDFFGELSALQDSARTASVEAMSDCTLFALDAPALQELMDTHPEFRTVVERRIAGYDYEKEARVPLDFAQETLPADALVNKVEIDEETDAEEEAPKVEAEAAKVRNGLFRRRKKSVRGIPFVRQIDEMDCGAAALAMICRHFGRRVSLARIRQLVHTALDGTSLKAIVHGASELGLAARAVRVSTADLEAVSLPSIIHWEGNHWVVLVAVRKRHVRVADPALGIRWVSRQEFEGKWSGYAALFDYTQDFEKAAEGKGTWGWALQFVKPFRWTLAQILVLAIVASGLQMLLPVFTQVIVDKVIVEHDTAILHIMVVAMITALAFLLGTNILQRFMLSFAAVHIDAAILDYLTRKMLALPMAYFNSRRVGDIQRRLAGARQVREFVVQSGIRGLLSIVQIIAYLSIMAMYSLTLLLVFLATVPVYAGLMFFSTKVLRPLFTKLEESYGRYSSHQIDAIKGIEAVKAASAEQAFRDTMLNEFLSVSRTQFRSNFVIMFYESAIQAVGFLSSVLFLWVGALMVMDGRLTLGGFVAFNSLVAMAYSPIMTALNLWDDLQKSSVLMDRLNDIFEFEPEQGHDRSNLKPVPTLEGRVQFRNVTFSYGGPGSTEILKDIDFEIPPGKTVAIVGRSGSGKTTLVKCLTGLLEPTEGTILFDGVDMKTLNYRELRHQVGLVLQDNYMFNDSILRNIAFGDPEPDLDRAMWAAEIANAHGFISRLPLGYKTKAGETGLALSGGQCQRIAIARALYNNPPILIFDEATSSLDTESERAIQDNLARLLANRTAFIIAHRLSTIRNADHIIVLEQGRVAEQGTHDELMELRGLYFYLCSQQMGLD